MFMKLQYNLTFLLIFSLTVVLAGNVQGDENVEISSLKLIGYILEYKASRQKKYTIEVFIFLYPNFNLLSLFFPRS